MIVQKKLGRPKSDLSLNERLYIRVNKEEKEEIMSFSKENNCTLLQLIRLGIEKVRENK